MMESSKMWRIADTHSPQSLLSEMGLDDPLLIKDFQSIRDIVHSIIDHNREKVKEVVSSILDERGGLVFIDGTSQFALETFLSSGFLVFGMEPVEGGYWLTESSAKSGISPVVATHRIPMLVEESGRDVLIENINYILDSAGVDKTRRMLSSLLKLSEQRRVVITGSIIEDLVPFFERVYHLPECVFSEPEGGIFLSSPRDGCMEVSFSNGYVSLLGRAYTYGRISFEVYELIKEHGGCIQVRGFEEVEREHEAARPWLKAVMDAVYPNPVLLVGYRGNSYVKGRIYHNVDDFQNLNLPLVFLDAHILDIERLNLIGEILERAPNSYVLYDSLSLTLSGDVERIEWFDRMAARYGRIRHI